MKPKQIKAMLIQKGISLVDIAEAIGCPRSQVTMCINGDGLYQKVREEIAARLNKPVESIFNAHHPKPKRAQQTETV